MHSILKKFLRPGQEDLPELSNLEWLVLDLLRTGRERYGLEMVREAEGKLKRGTVYVLLGKMEKRRLISSEPADDTGRRKYKITGSGQRTYDAWRAASAAWAGGELA